MSKLAPRNGTKKLAIRFSDNDFYYTIAAFLRVLLPDESFTHHLANDLKFTKAQIVELFNGMAYSLYLLKQNAWRYKPGENTQSYLKITEKNVYLDGEVDSYLAEHTWDNGEFFCVDFTEAYIWSV